MLTQSQKAALKAYILADPVLSLKPNNSDGHYEIASILNTKFSPTFTVWKTSITVSEVGSAMSSSEVGGLTTANTNRLNTMAAYSGGTFNPSRADTRAGFDSVFSGAGGGVTRAALLALYKRAANHVEKLFAIGTGSDSTPATMTFEGDISYQDVGESLNS